MLQYKKASFASDQYLSAVYNAFVTLYVNIYLRKERTKASERPIW